MPTNKEFTDAERLNNEKIYNQAQATFIYKDFPLVVGGGCEKGKTVGDWIIHLTLQAAQKEIELTGVNVEDIRLSFKKISVK